VFVNQRGAGGGSAPVTLRISAECVTSQVLKAFTDCTLWEVYQAAVSLSFDEV